MMASSRVFSPVLLALCCACTSSNLPEEPPADNTVAYSRQGDRCIVTGARTPYDGDEVCRQAFLAQFVIGFSHGLRGVPVSIEWQPTPRGRAASHGYDCGFVAGERVARQSPAAQTGHARVSLPPPAL